MSEQIEKIRTLTVTTDRRVITDEGDVYEASVVVSIDPLGCIHIAATHTDERHLSLMQALLNNALKKISESYHPK